MNQLLPLIELNALPGLVVLADRKGKIVYANTRFLKAVQVTKDKAVGSSLISFWMPPHDEFEDILAKIETDENFQTRVRHEKVDGTTFFVQYEFSKVPAGDHPDQFYVIATGQIPMLGMSDDDKIAKLEQKLEQALRDEEGYRHVMESSPIAMSLSRVSDARYVAVNKMWCERTGFKKEEVLGRTSPELNVYRDLSVRKKLWDSFEKYGQVDDLELAFTNRNGENLYSLVSARKIQFKGEECLLYISTKIDALKKAEKKLAVSEENHRTILDMAPYAIVVSKLTDGTYLQVNKAFVNTSGYSADEAIGKTPFDLGLYVDPSDRNRLVKILTKEGRVDRMEIAFRGKDGTVSENIVSMSMFQYQGEDCIISMGVDVTERKAVERELGNYRKNLEKLVAERTHALEETQEKLVKKEKLATLGQLTATVSHELRNPLGVIRSSNFYLQRKVRLPDEKIKKHFNRIDEQISLCDAIVDELLEYTQGRKAELAVKNTVPWINRVIEQFRESNDIRIELMIDENLQPVAHDPDMMQRVLINLINNAVQAVTDKSEKALKENSLYQPQIDVEARQDENCFSLKVCDNGIGMAEHIREKAFEALFTTKARGTGIGLANVKKIVTEHGGSVELESVPDEGTKVTVILY